MKRKCLKKIYTRNAMTPLDRKSPHSTIQLNLTIRKIEVSYVLTGTSDDMQRHVPMQRNVATFDGLRFRSLFYCWGQFLKCSVGVYTFLFIGKIHPKTEIRDRNLSPSKVATFLYVCTCLWVGYYLPSLVFIHNYNSYMLLIYYLVSM